MPDITRAATYLLLLYHGSAAEDSLMLSSPYSVKLSSWRAVAMQILASQITAIF
jgi:hypothetical protein